MHAWTMMAATQPRIAPSPPGEVAPYRLREEPGQGHFDKVLSEKKQAVTSQTEPKKEIVSERKAARAQEKSDQGEKIQMVEESVDTKTPQEVESREVRVLRKVLKALGLSEEMIEKLVALEKEGALDLDDLVGLEALVALIGASPNFETPNTEEFKALKLEINELVNNMVSQLKNKDFAESMDMTQIAEVIEALEPLVNQESGLPVKSLEESTQGTSTDEPGTEGLSTEDAQKVVTPSQTTAQNQTGDSDQKGQGKETPADEKIQLVDRRSQEIPTEKVTPDTPGVKNVSIKGQEVALQEVVKNAKVFEQVKSQVMNQITKGTVQLDDGSSEMTVKLKPGTLGEVHLKLSIEKGVVLAEMRVASEVVKQAIESQLADLKQSLADKGFGVGGLNVSVNKDQTQGQAHSHQQQQRRRPLVLRPDTQDLPYDAFVDLGESMSAIDYLG